MGIWKMHATSNALYAAGGFHLHTYTATGTVQSYNIMKYQSNAWHNLGNGVYRGPMDTNGHAASWGDARAIAEGPNGDIYVGGRFRFMTPEGVAENIARWDGNQWYPVGEGLEADRYGVVDLVWGDDGMLYACSEEGMRSEGNYLRLVAQWDGEHWTMVGEGIKHSVGSLVWWEGELYVGGSHVMQTGDGRNLVGLARFNGTNWVPLDAAEPELSGKAQALAGDASGLYAAGSIAEAGGEPVSHIVKWAEPYLPTLDPPPQTIVWGNPGEEVDVPVTAYISHNCDVPLEVKFSVEGEATEYITVVTNVSAGRDVTFTNSYPFGDHDINISVQEAGRPR
jgi:hypothetical protein